MYYQNLIQHLKNKDSECLETLYVGYGQQFYSYCVQRWGMTEDAAWEAVYKTLEAIVAKAAQYEFESEAHFHNFFYKVLTNNIRQQYRKEMAAKVALEFVDLDREEVLPENVQSVLNELAFTHYYEQEEEVESPVLESIRTALSRLEPNDRDLLLLKAQHYTYEEIARLLGIENNQLKVKHHRAKTKLINHLKNISNHE